MTEVGVERFCQFLGDPEHCHEQPVEAIPAHLGGRRPFLQEGCALGLEDPADVACRRKTGVSTHMNSLCNRGL
jgi:hypothetical protein